MKLILAQFFEALNIQETRFIPEIASDRWGMLLRAAINELDWYYYNFRQQDQPTPEEEERLYILQLGTNRLIQLSLETRRSFDAPTITFRRTNQVSLAALAIVEALGTIEHGRRVAQTVSSGLCRIDMSGPNQFLITLPVNIPDEDYYERSVTSHYRQQSKKNFFDFLNSEFGTELNSKIQKLLIDIVYSYEKHYIGYGADPLLDDYFFGVALNEMQGLEGYDTFHYSTKFGGISFQKYILTLTYFLSNYFRHEKFAEALAKKDPSIKLENVLTVSSSTSGFVESICDANNYFGSAYVDFEETSIDEAKRIFEVLSISRKNTKLLDRPGAATPLAVQCSDTDFIRCGIGAYFNPIQFLLDSLRHHFPSDYDRNQQSREKSMQAASKRVLNEAIPGLNYLQNVKLKINGKFLTDIDLVVLEESSGAIFLCQLKYQELYGADLHAKNTRANRLKTQTIQWLTAIEHWMERAGNGGIRSTLRLEKTFPPPKLFILVLAKNYAYPIRDLAKIPTITYANWSQFFNAIQLMKKEKETQNSLINLFSILKKGQLLQGLQTHVDEPRSDWMIRDLKFTVIQEQPVSPPLR